MDAGEYHVLARVETTHWWFRHLHRQVLDALRQEAQRLGRPLRLFDAGCGTGGLLVQLIRQPWVERVGGCEPNPIAQDYCRQRGLQVEACGIEALAPRASAMELDVVLCLDVLYHRDVQPQRATAVLAQMLRPGGLLLLNVAAMPCLRRAHDSRVYGGRRFLPPQLQALANTNGLEIEQLRYWNSWLTPLLWCRIQLAAGDHTQQQGDSELAPPGAALNQLLSGLLWLEHRLSRWAPLPFGSSLFLKARRR